MRRKLWSKMYLKAYRRLMFRPDKTLRMVFPTDLLSGKTPELVKSLYLSASDTDKRTEFYDVFTSDYAIHALALKLLSRFPSYDFQRLAKFHDSLEANLKVKYWQVIGFVVAVASFLLKDMPEAVVKNLGIDYSSYQTYVFYTGAVAFAYLSVVIAVPWYITARQKLEHKFVGDVLRYTALLLEKHS